MAGLPAALYRGTCSGHGRTYPAHQHSVENCGTTCMTVKVQLPVAVKDGVCMWPPAVLAPAGPYLRTVIVNGIIPICDQDVLTPHKSPTTNIVMVGPCGQTPPVPMPCVCSLLTAEDARGIGHPRKLTALTKTVYANKLAMGKVGDPLGPPCISTISQGSPNVFIGP
jgi:hypothetical protein